MAFLVDIAKYIPDVLVRNEDMVQFPERFRNLILEKAGIASRYHVKPGECTSDIGIRAVEKLLAKTGIDPAAVEAIICATSSPDRLIPATATKIQEACGLHNAFAFDINSACAGSIYALRLASGLIKDGLKNVVVVAAEVYSEILNPKDIATYPYFGDGSAAALISDQGSYELVDFDLGSNGAKADSAQVPAGGTMFHGSKVEDSKDFFLSMKGSDIFKFACDKGPELILKMVNKHGLHPDRVITHQANLLIIHEIAKRTNLPMDKFFVNVDKYGNTAGASTMIALSESLEENTADQDIFMAAFGAGLSWGGCYLRKVR